MKPLPLPKVSAKHYAPQPPAAAKIRWRLKGACDGPIYQGQKEITPCQGCRGRKKVPRRDPRFDIAQEV